MTLANDSILVTPGSGATVATFLVDAKEHQVVMLAGTKGHIWASAAAFIVDTGLSVNVAAARTTHFDLFNAAGSGVVLELNGLFILPSLTAVTGVGLTWEFIKTTAVGTGGSTLTSRSFDSDNTALPVGVTARSKPTGGATTEFIWQFCNTSSEETNPYAGSASVLNHLGYSTFPDVQTLTLREGQGVKLDQTFNSSVGSTNVRLVFTVK